MAKKTNEELFNEAQKPLLVPGFNKKEIQSIAIEGVKKAVESGEIKTTSLYLVRTNFTPYEEEQERRNVSIYYDSKLFDELKKAGYNNVDEVNALFNKFSTDPQSLTEKEFNIVVALATGFLLADYVIQRFYNSLDSKHIFALSFREDLSFIDIGIISSSSSDHEFTILSNTVHIATTDIINITIEAL